MARVSFFIKKQENKEGLAQIYLQLTDKGLRKAFFTGEKIPLRYWNPEKQRVRSEYAYAYDINKELKEKHDAAELILHELRHNFNFEAAKDRVEAIFQKHIPTGETIDAKIDDFLKWQKNKIVESTAKKYRTLKDLLKEFSEKKNVALVFENINKRFGERFIDYLMMDKGQLNNTWEKYISCLRTFLTWCETEQGIRLDPAYRKFRGTKHSIEVIYLTETELMHLYYLKLPTPTLEKVRDVFCFACWTGLRYSDVAVLTKANIKNDAITIKTQKTSDDIVIPLNQYSQAILEKYEYKLPVYTNQKSNGYLKDIAKIAELNSMEKIVQFRGSERIEEIKPKHELLSFHDARRTFIVLLLIKGVAPRIVMQMTGHKSYASFEKYVKIADTVTRNEMKRVWG